MDYGLVALYKLHFTFISLEADLSLITIDFIQYYIRKSRICSQRSCLEIFKIVAFNCAGLPITT